MKISKHDDVYIKCEVDKSLSRELSDYFTFEVPGAKYMPMVRNRMWDGKVRLFSQQTNLIYYGLLPYVKKFCELNNVEYTVEGLDPENNVDPELLVKFIASLKTGLRIRDYQLKAIYEAIKRKRGLFLSPTASGKSFIIYCIVRYVNLAIDKKILVIVPTTSLVEQMASDFVGYGYKEKYIHKIYGGQGRDTHKKIVISTWQSLYKLPKKYFEQFECIIGDEAHLFKSKSLTSILSKMEICPYRYGFTGTLDGTQTHRLVLEGLFGEVEKVTSTKELIDKKTLAELTIKCITLKHKEENARNLKDCSYQQEVDYLITNEKRNDFIVDLCERLPGNTLVLYQMVERHGQVLFDRMQKYPHKVSIVHGNIGTQEREDLRRITESSETSTIVASYGTFSTGINIKNIHNVVFASPSKSRVRVLQSIGRGLRKSDSKEAVTIFDISDDLSYNESLNYTLRHFNERINIYKEEQLDYHIDKVKL